MVLNINLDSVAGASGLTALTSGFERLDAWVQEAAARAGLPLATHLPLMPNSDHANFAAHGIPALRLIAGFNAPHSNLRYLLTAADTRDKVRPEELAEALRIATALTWEALDRCRCNALGPRIFVHLSITIRADRRPRCSLF